MPSLNWIGKEKIINHDKEVPFRLLKKHKGLSLGTSENLIIEGDNLEALKALMPYYVGKVKCIYIDPPYNTGNEGWVYNDNVNSPKIKQWIGKVVGSEGEDLTRHDKWLCMMYPRLKLLRDLLSDDGSIFISIDDNEHCHLKMIMDEIFGIENFVANIIWQKKYSPQNDAKYFSDMHDFIVVYAKKKNVGSETSGWVRNLAVRTEEQNARYKNIDNDTRGVWKSSDLSVKTYSKEYDYPIVNPKGRIVNPPKGACWRVSKDRFEELKNDNRIWFGPKGEGVPSLKRFLSEVQQGIVPVTLWLHEEVGHNQEAKQEIKRILQSDSPFETPKPTRLIKKILQIATNKDDLVLDSFAGSGTTGQAVLEANKEDGGNRKFILVEMEKDIAHKITSERVRRVSKDLNGGFEYCTLGNKLFNADRAIDEDVVFDDLANYIYFTETQTNLEKKQISGNFIGEHNESDFYLLFKEKGKNTLTKSFLKNVNRNDHKKIIYADFCTIPDELIQTYNITFKQIPYEVKVY